MREIELLGKYGGVSLVDDGDFDFLSQFSWHQTGSGYAARSIRTGPDTTEVIFMHQLIFPNYIKGIHEIDHKDRDKLNNTRDNLIITSKSGNQHNRSTREDSTSGYSGVNRHTDGRWRARIQINNKRIHLGLFDTPEEASVAVEKERAKYLADLQRDND
jgi:hypothetical protein